LSPEQKTGQRHNCKNSNKTLLKEIVRKKKRKAQPEKQWAPAWWQGGIDQPNFIARKERTNAREGVDSAEWHRSLDFFVETQFISCKVEKTWAVLREGRGWLAGLLNTALSNNKGYSAHVLCLFLGL
jgi:hypothetical protein